MLAHRVNQGFTLVEMIITVAIAAIVLGMGVPGFQQLIRANRTVTEVNRLVTALSLARSEAARRSATVAMCPTSGATWENGWVVFTDNVTPLSCARVQNGTIDAGEQVLQVYEGMPQGYTLRPGPTFTNWIAFQPTGQMLGSGVPLVADCFRVYDDTQAAAESRRIQVNLVGRANASKTIGGCP